MAPLVEGRGSSPLMMAEAGGGSIGVKGKKVVGSINPNEEEVDAIGKNEDDEDEG